MKKENKSIYKIKEINFGILNKEQIINMSEIEVFNRDLYNKETKDTATRGCLDRRLGISSKNGTCLTCKKKLVDCIGHFGYIKLYYPVFHIGFFKACISILQKICKSCGSLLIEENTKLVLLEKLKKDCKKKEKIFLTIETLSKKTTECFTCGYQNGFIKKGDGLVILFFDRKKKRKKHIKKEAEELTPISVLDLFKKINEIDCQLLGFKTSLSKPENLIITHLMVPPSCIRPSVQMMSKEGTNEDDLTIKLSDIIFANEVLKSAVEKGESMKSIFDDWQFLQLQCAMYINSNLPGIQKNIKISNEKICGLVQRLTGKKGRFRGNLSGKRVDFSSRTVITPDPNLNIDQVGVPLHIAKILTYGEQVTDRNLEILKKKILNGPRNHPGANYIQKKEGLKLYLGYGNREKTASKLSIGDIVERHMETGDIVLFNRQPSLHRISVMSHKVVVMNNSTFRFNPCVCLPYNADFDGDEMNIHFPQTEEAKAEAENLLNVVENITSPRGGQIVISPLQDMITALYLFTSKDLFYTKNEFSQLCSMFSFQGTKIKIPKSSILKPIELWTGKQIFSVVFNPTGKKFPFLFKAKTRGYSQKKEKDPIMDIKDGYLFIYGDEIMCGRLDKSIVGSDTKEKSVFYFMTRFYGKKYTAECLNRLTQLLARWISERGITIGLNDVTPGERLLDLKKDLINKGYSKCQKILQKDIKNIVEIKIRGTLNKIREEMGKICIKELSKNNYVNIMQECGSKGSKINIAQMIGCVGQQVVNGLRISGGYSRKTLPHFVSSENPLSGGFIQNSFYSGLTPTEFFFHAVSGREGIVDTAVKTAETGYMQRRLMKALEDLCVQYDYTVRDSEGFLFQFQYGDDGIDSMETEHFSRPLFLDPFIGKNHFIKEKAVSIKTISSLIEKEVELIGYSDMFKKEVYSLFKEGRKGKTLKQIKEDLKKISEKYKKAKMEPGTTCGAIAAQSIGEPGTQMTLKTFHFTGVASMNITQGIPRLKEIINATKEISTPILTVGIEIPTLKEAKKIKRRIECVFLKDILKKIKLVITKTESYLSLIIDKKQLKDRDFIIDTKQIKKILLKKRLKLKEEEIKEGLDFIKIIPIFDKNTNILFLLNKLKRELPDILICGINKIKRVIISKKEETSDYLLLIEGNGISEIRAIEGVSKSKIKSNNILEIENVLGIEVARQAIVEELGTTMKSHGINVDTRHLTVLADTMTQTGTVLGITRFGISKMKESVMMLSSFEKTTEHLFNASLDGKKDCLSGVSESVIVGKMPNIGTGLFCLLENSV